ncbi:site-specific integrase [Streptomyces noursei]|uniref:site-specific integrase n=1 Tax=Streptomyces noursei TaxID=1971 RepID=UPI00045F0C46|nr:site-specific integrase [Streptomyces noursei]AIA05223.1 phage integrase [Streptomyces noursei]
MLKAAVAEMEPFRRVVTPATRQRIRSTLRAALNTAIAQQLITFNPAAHVALEAGKRPKALVWTEERVLHWQRTGEKPSPVMVWKPEHTGLFLDRVSEDRLYALWHLIAFRGLRRGEACGQRWTDTHLADGRITVAKQLFVSGWEVYEDDPKTDAGARTIALDSGTIRALERHRAQQDEDRAAWGSAWVETGRVFTLENGELLHPANVTVRFAELCEEAGLPPIRLHDLRHGAATLAHAAGADLKDIQEMLGHSSIAITADTYTSLLPETDRAIAEAAARLVPRARPTKSATETEKNLEAAEKSGADGEESGSGAVPNGAGKSAPEPGPGAPSAHAPRTQTAPDVESEAE